MSELPVAPRPVAPRRSLFTKYFCALFAAVVAPLLIAGGSEAWFGYHDQRARLNDLLDAEARLAAVKIQDFIEGIREQLGWTVQLPLSENTGDRHRLDALGLLRQVPAVISLSLVDAAGKERLFVSRIGLNRIGSGDDHSAKPAVLGARSDRDLVRPGDVPVRLGTVHDHRDRGQPLGGRGGRRRGQPEIHLGRDLGESGSGAPARRSCSTCREGSSPIRTSAWCCGPTKPRRNRCRPCAMPSFVTGPGQAATGQDLAGKTVLAAMAQIPGVDWSVIVKQSLAEAYRPIYAALWRTAALLVAGAVLAAVLAYWLTQRMVGPIRLLEDGVARIGAGQFDHRISLATGDEFERLATRFNAMAGELSVSQERSERISRLKRFLAPQVAELVDRIGDDRVLDGRRVEVVVVFCDLRGFTAFSARAEPETIIGVLREYYDALERVVSAHGATLISFPGDGVMVLLNAPVSCSDPALRAVKMARDMQASVQNAPGRLARARPAARLRRGAGHGTCHGRADRLGRPP